MAAPVFAGLTVTGLVQGVGFRPHVWRVAQRLGLRGTVRNQGDAVVIRVAGPASRVAAMPQALRAGAPPRSRIEKIEIQPVAAFAAGNFTIEASSPGEVTAGIVADLAICADCLAEIADPSARRFRYPFTNCTQCGPRFSIVTGLPYDRARTTMAAFALCDACRGEYGCPADRRFHAEPIACPACGPRLWWHDDPPGPGVNGSGLDADAPLTRAVAALRQGQIIAIKGLGGYHLACDAANEASVAALRMRKHRPSKPFAVMMRMAEVARHCVVSASEAAMLADPAAPVVLLAFGPQPALAPSLAPGLDRLGVMLPATPLHCLLLAAFGAPLVMTSANRAGSPQIYQDEAARTELAGIADGLLGHDRPIARRLEDSVMLHAGGAARVLRRGRGLAPEPLSLAAGFVQAPAILAMGADLKSAFCLTQNGRAVLSHHLGDLGDPATEAALEAGLADYTALFTHCPAAIAVDLHPGYRSTLLGAAMAGRLGLKLLAIQHHHAHIAAVLAEHGWKLPGPPVVGVALDGLGLGDDGALWGAEVLICDYVQSRRVGRLRPVPMPGGDRASREPWRMLLAHLDTAFGAEATRMRLDAALRGGMFDGMPASSMRAMIAGNIHAPPASSAGRLFDAMAVLLGLSPHRLSHEGEAAMALEACARQIDAALPLPFAIRAHPAALTEIDPAPMWDAALAGLARGVTPPELARAFHHGLAHSFACVAIEAAREAGADTVALSGGTMQNGLLLDALLAELTAAGLRVLAPNMAPANDGGIALGQAVVAAARLMQ